MADEIEINRVEVNLLALQINIVGDEKRDFTLPVGDENVRIPLNIDIFAHYVNQFPTNTPNQKRRRSTLVNLMRAAYLQGVRDGCEPQQYSHDPRGAK